MKTISIRNLDDGIYKIIKSAARERGTSINKLIISGLEKIFRPERGKIPEYHDMDDLFGTWTEEEFNEFSEALNAQRGLDGELWK